MDLEKIEARIDRIELKLVELQIKLDYLLEQNEKLIALGLALSPHELDDIKAKMTQLTLDLEARQN